MKITQTLKEAIEMIKRIISVLALIVGITSCFAQEVTKRDIEIRNTTPQLYLNGVGAKIKLYTDIELTRSADGNYLKINDDSAATISEVRSRDNAIKNYVDGVISTGISWVAPVEDIVSALATGIDIDKRYILSTDGHIYTSDGDDTWTDLGASALGTACYVKADDAAPENNIGQYNYNGSDWVYIGSGGIHNDLTGIQGGTTSEYYHMTATQHGLATQVANTTQSGILSNSDWNTFNSKLSTNGSAANLTGFPTLNQNTTGSAATLTTPRSIYGNNFDGSASLTQVIASTYGGTGNGFTKFTGANTTEKTYTLPNQNATLLYTGGPLGTPSGGTMTNVTGTASGLTAGAVTGYTPAGGSLTLSGADAITLTTSAATSVTLPTAGTLATTTDLASYALSSHTHAQTAITALADSLLARYTKTQMNTILGSYLLEADTAAMLDPYFLKTDNLDFSQVNMTEGDYAELEDYAVMLADTTLLKTFEFGSGLMKDTADFYNGAIKSFYNAGSDTLAITSLMGIMAEGVGTESVGVQVSWHTTLKSGSATNLNSSAYTVTSLTTGDEDVSFANAKIPPGNFVWATLSGITSGNKPSYLAANLSGYRIPGISGIIPDEECTYTQNLVLYSEQLNLGYWNKFDLSVTATDAEYDLDGNATLEEVTTTNASHRMHCDEVDVIAGETYRFSFDVKRGTMTGLAYGIYDITNAGWIADGVSYYSSTSASVSRVNFEFTAPAGCTQVWVYPLRNSGATGTVYLGRVQIEENGSCYVETTSSVITP